MTILSEGLNTTGEYAENTKRSKKSQALRMTALSGALNTTGEYAENTKRSRKSQALRRTILSGGLEPEQCREKRLGIALCEPAASCPFHVGISTLLLTL
jgi:hypothetical protein